jgi:hypothetical protein
MSRHTNQRPRRAPRPRPLPRITDEEAAAIILSRWPRAEGSRISEEQAKHWAFLFLFHLKYEPTPNWLPPRARTRPERPTAERLEEFLGLETDWIRRTPNTQPVRRQAEDSGVIP